MTKGPFHQNSGLAVEDHDLLIAGLDLGPDHLDVAIPALLYLRVLFVVRVLHLVAQQRCSHDVLVCLYRPKLLQLIKVVIRSNPGSFLYHVLYDARIRIRIQFYT